MTDFLNRFGAVTNAGSADVIDFGEISEGAVFDSHRTGEANNQQAVFHTPANITGTVTPKLQDCDDATVTTPVWTDLVTGAGVVNPKAGNFALIPMPKKHKRYVRASLSAALPQGATVTAFMEPGAKG